jgi:hypothetical protein
MRTVEWIYAKNPTHVRSIWEIFLAWARLNERSGVGVYVNAFRYKISAIFDH